MDDETTGRLPDDDTELTRVTPPDDATRVMPAAGEGQTQVMPGADTGATRVMPAQGAGGPPPPSQPTLLMTHGRSSDDGGGVPWWVWLLVVLAIVAAAVALWYFYLRPQDTTTSAGDVFIGNWAPEAGTGGGLVIKQSGDQFKIIQYDPQLQQAGSTNADLVGDALEVSVKASALGLTGVTGTVKGTLTHDSANDTLTLQFSSGSLQLDPIGYVRVDVLLPASPSPSPSPTASPSPTLSPSPTTTAQPQPVGLPDCGPAGAGQHRQAAGGHRGLGGGQQQPVPAAAGRRRGRRHLPVRHSLADQRVHRPAHGAGHRAGQLRVRAAERRPGVQAHRLPQQRTHLLGAVTHRAARRS